MSNNEQMPAPDKKNEKEKETIVKKNMSDWFTEVGGGDSKLVASFYEGTLHSTLSGFRKDTEGIIDYFNHFLAKNPTGKIKIIEGKAQESVIWNNEKSYTHKGVYIFTFKPENGAETSVDADFTFVWEEKEKNKWKIIQHHSSLIPNDEQKNILDSLEIPKDVDNSVTQKLKDGSTLFSGEIEKDGETIRFTKQFNDEGEIIHQHLSFREKE